MKRISLLRLGIYCLACVSCTLALSQNNIVVVQTRHVSQENIEAFVHRETTYWKVIAERAIKESKLYDWSFWRRVDGFDLHDGHNYIFVNTFTPEQFRAYSEDDSIWDYEKAFPKARMKDIDTMGLSEVRDQLYYQNLYYVESSPAKYIRVNFADASDLRTYAKLEPEIWGPFITKHMDKGTTSVVSWGFSQLVLPRGRDMPHNAVSVDGFANLADALGRSFTSDVEAPEDVSKLFEVHEKSEVHVYQLIARAEK